MTSKKMDGISITDLIWDSSNFVLNLKQNKDSISLTPEKNEFSDKTPRPSKAFVDIKKYKQLIEIKEKISNCTHWDKWSRLTNPYDKIQYLAKNKNTKDYYKYFELFKYFNITRDFEESGTSASMGDSALNAVKALTYFLPKTNWYALVDNNVSVPREEKNKSQTDLNKVLETDLENSKDDNGYSRLLYIDKDVNLVENLKNFQETVKCKCDIIIGDCTTDTEHDRNNRKRLSFHLLFVQIVNALHMQKEDGHLIIKFLIL